jgi:hypothetical protein
MDRLLRVLSRFAGKVWAMASTVGKQWKIVDEAMRAFLVALSRVEPSAPTWSTGWSAHEVTAHVAAAAQERADLIEEHLAGQPARATRTWQEREPPFRELPGEQLRDRLVLEAGRFERAVADMVADDSIVYTGWEMTAERLRTHSHSEAALHRWDLVGEDETSRRLLSEPVLTSHALAVFAAIPALGQRWTEARFTTRPVRLRSPGQPDVLVDPGSGLSLLAPVDGDLVIHLDPDDRLLILWGRCPSALRSPTANAETVDDLLVRLRG